MFSNRFMEPLETRLVSAIESSAFRTDVCGGFAMGRPPFSQEPNVRDFADSQVPVRPCLVPGGRSR